MKAVAIFAAAAFIAIAWFGSAAAQQEAMVGSWLATDPSSGEQEVLVFADDYLQFGPNEPQVLYSATRAGNVISIHIGDDSLPPALFTLIDDNTAQLAIPGAPTIPLTRVAAAPAEAAPPSAAPPAGAQTAAPPAGQSAMDEMLAAFVPFGVQTRFEPLNQSLEQLLSDGWSLDQAGGASGGFTLLLSKGDTRALCMLIPQSLGQAATALSDCRRLN